MRTRLKQNWSVTEAGFNKLLEALDPDRQRAAEQYEHLRRSLIRYFDWRGCVESERDADETIDRVIRKLSEGPGVDDLHTYALGVARNVALESLRAQQKEKALIDLAPSNDWTADEESEFRFDCFENCLGGLAAAKREFILAYYEGSKRTKILNRQKLADRLGIPIGRLRIQAHRIREKLENCIAQCLSAKNGPGSIN
jgi:RNA polymerase sigma factor (sigma-70 family)